MEELGYRDNPADKRIFRSAVDWGKHIYRNWFSGNGGNGTKPYENKLTGAPPHEIKKIMEEWDNYLVEVDQGSVKVPSNGKSFYKALMGKFSFGKNGKGKNKQASVQPDSSIGKPLPKEFYGELIEEELLELVTEYPFEDGVPLEEELLEMKMDEEILELVPEKTRRKHHTDKYILSEDMKNSLKVEDTETLAKYFMSIEGVGYKTVARLLGEVGKSADEKQLRKWYKAVKNKEYETVEEFSHKYSLMLDELYESEMEGCGGAAYPSGTMNTEDNEIALQDEALMFENGGTDRYNPTEILAKSIMSVKGIKPKKAGRLLTKYYEKVGGKVDFDESQLKTWYEEVMKENGSRPQFKNLDDWARYVVNLHGTPEITDEKKDYRVMKRKKSKWQYYKPLAPLLIPAALMVVAADVSLNYKLSDKAFEFVGLKKPAYTEIYKQEKPFEPLYSPAKKDAAPSVTSLTKDKLESLSSTGKTVTPAKSVVDAAPKVNMHKVVKGECLWKITEKHYGNGNKWHVIQENNKVKYPSLEDNPHYIESDWMLKIPKF